MNRNEALLNMTSEFNVNPFTSTPWQRQSTVARSSRSVQRVFFRMLAVLLLESGALTATLANPPSLTGAAGDFSETRPGPAKPSQLTLDRIFKSGDFTPESVPFTTWSKKGSHYFHLRPAGGGVKGKDLVRIEIESGAMLTLVDAASLTPPGAEKPLDPASFEFSEDESQLLLFTDTHRVWRRNTRGNYWHLDLKTRELKKLGGEAPEGTLMFAKFSPDATRVAYVQEANLHMQDLQSLAITKVTSGTNHLIHGTSDWVYEEELDVRDAFRWSPDGKHLAFWQFDTSGVPVFQLINNTDENYPKLTPIPYPKAGEQNASVRLGVVAVGGGAITWLDLPGDPRQHYPAHLEWIPETSRLLVQQFNRAQNTNRVFTADAATGACHEILVESDPAWLENDNPVRCLQKGAQLLWLSERDGWRRAYVASTKRGLEHPVTRGSFDVMQVEAIDEAQGWLYYAASPEEATRRYLYRSPLAGGPPERVTPPHFQGWNTYSISPDARWALHTHSSFVSPPRVELIRLTSHERVRTLATNDKMRGHLAALKRPDVQFHRVPIASGVELDAWSIRPPGRLGSGRHPLLFYVYGEPHGQTVRDTWQGSRGLWHMMLAQQGCIVASVDNRGTPSPRGREWRRAPHLKLGILPPQEQAEAARALLQRWKFVDRQRVGIWGWSGGGSMTLNAIFKYPELYQVGLAVAPVPDMRLYDTIYQERYMGLPAANAEGYREGSAVHFAKDLRGRLWLAHGTGDDNCHYQGIERLANELIAHHKHFTLLPYPNRSHSISESANTTRHLHASMMRFLEDHLLRNPSRGR